LKRYRSVYATAPNHVGSIHPQGWVPIETAASRVIEQ